MTARLIMKMTVAEAVPNTPDVVVYSFAHPRRRELPGWTAGAHVDLRLPDGKTRQYSLIGDPEDRAHYRIAVKREDVGRGGSKHIHDTFAAGAEAHVSAPRNNFPLAAGPRHVFVAGGIGVTPVAAMARELARKDADFVVHFCARSDVTAPLLDELRGICGERLQTWFAADGRRFSAAVLEAYTPGANLYACGPQRLLDDVGIFAAAAGWPDASIHAEVFQPTLDENFKAEPFDALIASTGQLIRVPADKSLLDELRTAGFAMPSSCELGVCGACICGYRDGIIIHRDAVLPLAARQDRMTPCVSRARNAVTLDL